MAHVGGMLGFRLGLQGRIEREGGATTTLVEFLRESMNSSDRFTRRKTFKVRLGFNGCCGASWGSGPSRNMSVRGEDDNDEDHEEGGGNSPELGVEVRNVDQTEPENGSTPACVVDVPASSGMNLAAALAAERQFRAAQEFDAVIGLSQSPIRPNNHASAGTRMENGSPLRVSLMKLLEETDGCDGEEMEKEGVRSDSLCCVCMGRKKGAAFIPCGHTFCRVCSRELWLNRGFCPLCNRSILEILDIF